MKKLEWFLNSVTGLVTGFKITDIKKYGMNGQPCIYFNGFNDYIDFE